MSDYTIGLIEIRRAGNGFVITAMRPPHMVDNAAPGYLTRVCEGDDPDALGAAVAKLLRDHPITSEVSIRPARSILGQNSL